MLRNDCLRGKNINTFRLLGSTPIETPTMIIVNYMIHILFVNGHSINLTNIDKIMKSFSSQIHPSRPLSPCAITTGLWGRSRRSTTGNFVSRDQVWRGSPVHCEMFRGLSVLYLIDATSFPSGMTNKNVSRHCKVSPVGSNPTLVAVHWCVLSCIHF